MDTMSETLDSATQGATAPAVESVPQPAIETAPDTGQEQQADTAEQQDETPEEPKRKPWFQQRIDELTREKHEARRQAEAYAAVLRQIQQTQQTQPEPQTPHALRRSSLRQPASTKRATPSRITAKASFPIFRRLWRTSK